MQLGQLQLTNPKYHFLSIDVKKAKDFIVELIVTSNITLSTLVLVHLGKYVFKQKFYTHNHLFIY